MNARPFLDPRKIPNNFRLQPLIEEEFTKAKNLIFTRQEFTEFSNHELTNVGLVLLETGIWVGVTSFASVVLKTEEQKMPDKQDKEIIATAYYMLATTKCAQNQYDNAIHEYHQANKLAQSPWLKSNILRNIGIAYLESEKFEEAAKVFEEVLSYVEGFNDNYFVFSPHFIELDQVKHGIYQELKGSLPALYNYYAISLTKADLKNNQYPTRGLAVLHETNKLYKRLFAEKNIDEETQLKSHDWQLHEYHCGVIFCQIADLELKENELAAKIKFILAEKMLILAHKRRIVIRADDRCLGDVCLWIGRTYQGLNNIAQAKYYFQVALIHFNKAFASKPDAPQIKDAQIRLQSLNNYPNIAASQSGFFAHPSSYFSASRDTSRSPQKHHSL